MCPKFGHILDTFFGLDTFWTPFGHILDTFGVWTHFGHLSRKSVQNVSIGTLFRSTDNGARDLQIQNWFLWVFLPSFRPRDRQFNQRQGCPLLFTITLAGHCSVNSSKCIRPPIWQYLFTFWQNRGTIYRAGARLCIQYAKECDKARWTNFRKFHHYRILRSLQNIIKMAYQSVFEPRPFPGMVHPANSESGEG